MHDQHDVRCAGLLWYGIDDKNVAHCTVANKRMRRLAGQLQAVREECQIILATAGGAAAGGHSPLAQMLGAEGREAALVGACAGCVSVHMTQLCVRGDDTRAVYIPCCVTRQHM